MRLRSLKLRYHRVEQYVGKDFFKFWNFYTGPDPTHGTVQFVSEWEGWQDKLLSASEAGIWVAAVVEITSNRLKLLESTNIYIYMESTGVGMLRRLSHTRICQYGVVMRVDNTSKVPGEGGRKAVRIESKNSHPKSLRELSRVGAIQRPSLRMLYIDPEVTTAVSSYWPRTTCPRPVALGRPSGCSGTTLNIVGHAGASTTSWRPGLWHAFGSLTAASGVDPRAELRHHHVAHAGKL